MCLIILQLLFVLNTAAGASSHLQSQLHHQCRTFYSHTAIPQTREKVTAGLLYTQRFSLRPLQLSDVFSASRLLENEQVQQMSGDFVSSQSESYWKRMLNKFRFRTATAMDAYRTYRAFQKSSDILSGQDDIIFFGIFQDRQLIGVASLYRGSDYSDIRSTFIPNEVSLSYHLSPTIWGKGAATEISQRLIQFSFETLGASQVSAAVLKTNLGSKNVLQKLGLRKIDIEKDQSPLQESENDYYEIKKIEFTKDSAGNSQMN